MSPAVTLPAALKENRMRRLCTGILCAALGPVFAQAQGSDPLSTEVKQAWTRTIGNVVAAAEKMPDDGYSFKPTPESMSFRDLVAHTADSAMGSCSALNGERKSAGAAKMQTKAELVDALKAAQAECDKAYTLTDAKATEMIAGGRGSRSRISTLWGNTVHIEHEYAQMAVVLRLKGLVPPSSEGRGGPGRGGR
jgi:uncharacterized damage-inducible protein DinB